jgi:threonine/homoserine/homoserine lactone efflux protein
VTLLQWLPLAGICLAGAASPGPSLAVVVRTSISSGVAAALATAWAHAAGVGCYALLTVLGISALLAAAPMLLTLIKVCGALYLLFIARGLLRSSSSNTETVRAPRASILRAARDGFAIAFLNPKLALFMLALFSQFLRPEYGAGEYAVLVATATLIDGLWYSLVAMLLAGGPWLRILRTRAALIDRGFGALLAALALVILLQAAGVRLSP